MTRSLHLASLLAIAASLCGCVTARSTTTPRTAIEAALLSESARRSLADLSVGDAAGMTYALDTGGFDAPGAGFVLGLLNERLMESGLRAPTGDAAPDLIVHPRAAFAGIDDFSFLLGLPEVPIPLPGIGAIRLPEFSIFKIDRQWGRSRIEAHAVRAEDGALAFTLPDHPGKAYYTRWTLLVFFGFSTTDLGEPF